MRVPDPYLKWGRLWQAARAPASFLLGAGLLIFEASHHPADQGILMAATGLIGLPFFAPYTPPSPPG